MKRATSAAIARVRATCLGLPNVVESGGTATGVGDELSGTGVTTWKVSGRVVARVFVLDPGGREDVVAWVRADPEERRALIESGGPFFRAGPREVGIVLTADTDWAEVDELVTESYLLMAPKKLAAEVEAAAQNRSRTRLRGSEGSSRSE